MLLDRWFRTETFGAQPETSSSSDSATDREKRAIRAVMASYNDALNNGSTDAALALYAEDAVFMPPSWRCGRTALIQASLNARNSPSDISPEAMANSR